MNSINIPAAVGYLLSRLVLLLTVAISAGCGGGDGNAIPAFTLFTGITIADLDGDKKYDLVTSNVYIDSSPPHPGHVTVSLQNAAMPGTFDSGVDYPVGADPQFVTTGDLNDDGRIDLLATNYSDDNLTLLEQSPVNAGVFQTAVHLNVASAPDGSVVTDINDDGLKDIVASGWYLSVLLNTQSAPGSFTDGGTINTNSYLPSVAAGDIDGDGRMDLAATDPASGTVLVFLQDPAPAPLGLFSSMTSWTAGDQPWDVELADLDGDTKLDLVVANLGTPTDPDSANLSVLIQNHDPAARSQFHTAVVYKTGARSQDVAVGDLNQDNLPDLSVANAGHLNDTGSLTILLQGPVPGTFLTTANIPGISQPLSVAIGDLDGDGLNDIAMADGGAAVLFQIPGAPGTFHPPVHIDF